MTGNGPKIAAFCIAGLLGAASVAGAATPVRLTGSIAGQVRDASGIVQMGATVTLLGRYEQVLQKILSDQNGNFLFDSLLPDTYSVRVSLATFMPAFKRNITVQPGLQSLLTINLAGLISSVELVYTAPPKGGLISEDWKWVLRSSQATRPVLRFRDVIYRDPVESASHGSVFSETRGLVRVSAGDPGSYTGIGGQPDLGTAFALATSLFGSNQLQVSGNVGVSSHAGLPTAGFRTTYSRSSDALAFPEVSVTMRQISLPVRGGFGSPAGGPALRTVSATMLESTRLLDNVTMDYGMSMESISILDRLNTITPFGRISVDMGDSGMLQFAYATGSVPQEFAQRPTAARAEVVHEQLRDDLSALAALPLVSMRNGHERVQRNESFEAGYRKEAGSRTYSFGAYRERMRDTVLLLAGADDSFGGSDILPDLGSNSAAINAGNFERWGYMASIAQAVGDNFEATLAYGRTGAMTTEGGGNTVDELRGALHMSNRNWATVKLAGTAPGVGTRFVASYGWMDTGTLMPARVSLTQSAGAEPGLNLSVRQPLPGRLEAIGEMRNILAQGYLPVCAGTRSAVLTNAPRSVRGGLAFIF